MAASSDKPRSSPSPSPAGAGRVKKAGPVKKAKGKSAPPLQEIGGPKGPEPTRYGDWEQKGRCSDF